MEQDADNPHVYVHAYTNTNTSVHGKFIRWLKTFKVHLASEKHRRSLSKEIRGDNLEAERGAFLFSREDGGEEIRDVPFVYVPNIVRKVADLLTHNERYYSSWCNVLTLSTCTCIGMVDSHDMMALSLKMSYGLSLAVTRDMALSNSLCNL